MKYKELADLFRAQILSGEIKAGEKLFESIAAVSAERGASNYSIRAALDVLAAEGLVEVRQGYGTVVVHRAGLNTPPQHIARILESSDPALKRARKITRGGEVVAASVSWIHADATAVVPEVASAVDRMPGGWQPLYITRTGADLTGHLVSREDIVIDADTARVLGVEGGGRGYTEVICTWTDGNGKVLEVRVDTYLPDAAPHPA